MISWQGFHGAARQSGMLQDLSSLGMGVLLDHSIPVGTEVTITYDRVQSVSAVVKHLVRQTYCCLIGVEFSLAKWGSTAQYLQSQAQMPVLMKETCTPLYATANTANLEASTIQVNEPQIAA